MTDDEDHEVLSECYMYKCMLYYIQVVHMHVYVVTVARVARVARWTGIDINVGTTSIVDTGCWILNTGNWELDTEHWVLNTEHSVLVL